MQSLFMQNTQNLTKKKGGADVKIQQIINEQEIIRD